MVEHFEIIERLTLVAPLGIRFWDTATGKNVGDGLDVTACPVDQPQLRIRAFKNLSGTYVLRNLPGLSRFEYGEGDQPARDFRIEVVDTQRRFLPFSFTASAPHKGVFIWDDPLESSPPYSLSGVPLYPAATRTTPGPMAVLRAELWDPWAGKYHQGGPAAWAMVEAELPDQATVRGISDEKGRIVLIFPYPNPIPDAFGSTQPLTERSWTISLRAAYEPLIPVPPFRDLSEILTQMPATLWADSEMTSPLTDVSLRFGQELFVKPQDYTTPVLLITPAGSPP